MDANGMMVGNRMDARNGGAMLSANGQAQVSQQQQMSYGNNKGNGYPNNRFNDPQQDRHGEPQDRNDDNTPDDYFISELYQQLSQVISAKPTDVEPARIGK